MRARSRVTAISPSNSSEPGSATGSPTSSDVGGAVGSSTSSAMRPPTGSRISIQPTMHAPAVAPVHAATIGLAATRSAARVAAHAVIRRRADDDLGVRAGPDHRAVIARPHPVGVGRPAPVDAPPLPRQVDVQLHRRRCPGPRRRRPTPSTRRSRRTTARRRHRRRGAASPTAAVTLVGAGRALDLTPTRSLHHSAISRGSRPPASLVFGTPHLLTVFAQRSYGDP